MLKSAEHSLLCWEVNLEPPNPGSLRFHKRIGFIEVGQTIPEYANYRVSYLSKSIKEL
jgi:predicted GNAT superfamily acetyltransferase